MDYFLVKFELISIIKISIQENRGKISKLKKNSRKIGKMFCKFYNKFGESCRKSVEFQNKFRECLKVKTSEKSTPSRKHRHRYFEKILRKT